MDHTRTKESLIEGKRKLQNKRNVENAVLTRQNNKNREALQIIMELDDSDE